MLVLLHVGGLCGIKFHRYMGGLESPVEIMQLSSTPASNIALPDEVENRGHGGDCPRPQVLAMIICHELDNFATHSLGQFRRFNEISPFFWFVSICPFALRARPCVGQQSEYFAEFPEQ